MTRILKAIYFLLAIGALFGAFFLLLRFKKSSETIIVIDSRQIPVSLAQTPLEREQGLSGTPSLVSETGKLFIFDKPGMYGFWMKEMKYPLDIVWIDQNKNIIAISNSLDPNTYPQIFYPPQNVLWVLELNAGDAQKMNLKTGMTTKLKVNFENWFYQSKKVVMVPRSIFAVSSQK